MNNLFQSIEWGSVSPKLIVKCWLPNRFDIDSGQMPLIEKVGNLEPLTIVALEP